MNPHRTTHERSANLRLLALLASIALSIALTGVGCKSDAEVSPADVASDAADTSGDAVEDLVDEIEDAVDAADDRSDLTADLPPDRLVVATLNLRCLIDDWDDRLPILVDALSALDPDLIGFQEACSEASGRDNVAELLDDLAEQTGRTYRVERAVTHVAWSTYDEGIAVVSTQPFDETTVESLPGGMFTRKVIAVRVTTELGAIVFATTHLDHQSSDARAGQIDKIVEVLDDFAEAGEVRLLTGDLNEEPTAGEVVSTLTEAGYTDIWSTLNPEDPGHTMTSADPTRRIDYVWLDPGSSDVEPQSADVFADEPMDGVFGSDHFGVTAAFDL